MSGEVILALSENKSMVCKFLLLCSRYMGNFKNISDYFYWLAYRSNGGELSFSEHNKELWGQFYVFCDECAETVDFIGSILEDRDDSKNV